MNPVDYVAVAAVVAVVAAVAAFDTVVVVDAVVADILVHVADHSSSHVGHPDLNGLVASNLDPYRPLVDAAENPPCGLDHQHCRLDT